MKKCVQCKEPADMHISFLAKKSIDEDEYQECDICSMCLSLIWNRHKNTQLGQTLTINEL